MFVKGGPEDIFQFIYWEGNPCTYNKSEISHFHRWLMCLLQSMFTQTDAFIKMNMMAMDSISSFLFTLNVDFIFI